MAARLRQLLNLEEDYKSNDLEADHIGRIIRDLSMHIDVMMVWDPRNLTWEIGPPYNGPTYWTDVIMAVVWDIKRRALLLFPGSLLNKAGITIEDGITTEISGVLLYALEDSESVLWNVFCPQILAWNPFDAMPPLSDFLGRVARENTSGVMLFESASVPKLRNHPNPHFLKVPRLKYVIQIPALDLDKVCAVFPSGLKRVNMIHNTHGTVSNNRIFMTCSEAPDIQKLVEDSPFSMWRTLLMLVFLTEVRAHGAASSLADEMVRPSPPPQPQPQPQPILQQLAQSQNQINGMPLDDLFRGVQTAAADPNAPPAVANFMRQLTPDLMSSALAALPAAMQGLGVAPVPMPPPNFPNPDPVDDIIEAHPTYSVSCPTCFDVFKPGPKTDVAVMECGHCVCMACFDRTIRQTQQCVVCRRNISYEGVHKLRVTPTKVVVRD